MRINNFKLERYFAEYEFSAEYLLSSSDCDGYGLKFLLDIASNNELYLWETMELGYTESEGHPLLREAVLQFYSGKTINNVVVASPGELNFITMNVLLDSSDHVVAVSPSYQSLYEITKSIGCELSYWRPDRENWEFNVEDLKNVIKNNTKLIVLNFPHNPTGSYLTPSQLSEIIEIAADNNIYIFSDEMYHKLVIDDVQELTPVCDLYEKGISLWGTSKSFGLAGLRTGWLVANDIDFLHKVVAFKDYLSICNSAPSEILSIIALNNINEFIHPNVKRIRNNISVFEDFIKKHQIFSDFIPPKAGTTAFVGLNIEDSSLDFSNQLVEKAGIMTVPSEMFEYRGKYIRVGFGRKNFSEVLDKFDEYLEIAVQQPGS